MTSKIEVEKAVLSTTWSRVMLGFAGSSVHLRKILISLQLAFKWRWVREAVHYIWLLQKKNVSVTQRHACTRARAHTLYPYTLDLILTYVCCASTRPSTVTELPLYFCVCVCVCVLLPHIFAWVAHKLLHFWTSLPLSLSPPVCVCLSPSLSGGGGRELLAVRCKHH